MCRYCFDQSSYSNPQQVSVTHHDIHLQIVTKEKILKGYVDYSITRHDQSAEHLILDSRHIHVDECFVNGNKAEFELKHPTDEHYHPTFGTPLYVSLKGLEGDKAVVRVVFRTSPKSEGLVWMEASQTLGKEKPFLFSQCQSIHARSVLPCQDTPEAKATFTASVTCDIDLVVVMGALPRKSTSGISFEQRVSENDISYEQMKSEEGKNGESNCVFEFEQKTPIPSYLIAIAAGNLGKVKIGPRSYLYTEPEQIDAFAREFEDTEKFIQAAEEFLEPYAWEEYNLLVASPSYNFGGMENPNLTLCSSTLLAGDKSLVSVVAHEIAHSWSGNLVTNRTWRDFWLNEGFTVYIERRILARIYGQAYSDFTAILGEKDLKDAVDHFVNVEKNPEFSKLRPDLQGVDPDDAFSSIPYEKGFNFLYYLTGIVGGFKNFEAFLKSYFSHFAYKTVSTDDFKAYFLDYFSKHHADDSALQARLKEVDWDAWVYGAGDIPQYNSFDRTLADAAEAEAKKWINRASNSENNNEKDESSFNTWMPMQYCYFIQRLSDKKDWTPEQLDTIDSQYHFSESKNFEILFAWLILCIHSNHEKMYEKAAEFLGKTGRMKFVRPMFRALLQARNGKKIAQETYEKYRDFYMSTTCKVLDKDFQLYSSEEVF